MILVIMVLFVSSLLVAGAFVATNGDIKLTRGTTTREKAYYAALAGIQVYQYQLNTNANYWSECSGVSKVPVPGTKSDEIYTYTTLPATGRGSCEPGKAASVIESATSANGTFRIKSTGVSGGASRSIVATLAHPGFLNYVWLTNFEQEDPITVSREREEECVPGHYYEWRSIHSLLKECPNVAIVGGEEHFRGPFHTNDASAICGNAKYGGRPSFGRFSADAVEMNEGYFEGCPKNEASEGPEILGKYSRTAPTLSLPQTSNELLEAAGVKFEGRTIIELKPGKPDTMAITRSTGLKETKNVPPNGVVYVSNSKVLGCGDKYSPFSGDWDYKHDAGCGNVYIKGTYTEPLTVAAANDIIITGNLMTSSEGSGKPIGEGMLGLIASNFIRVYHPVSETCGKDAGINHSKDCNAENLSAAEDPRGWGSTENIVVDAAILAAKHDWGVDNYECGDPLGTLNVWGTIAQYWRGRTRCCSTPDAPGYSKNYNYDERLATKQPPSFLAPTSAGGWKVTRETQPPE